MVEHLNTRGAPLPPLEHIPAEVASVTDYEPFARDRMTPAAWAYLSGGAGDEITLQDNVAAFGALRLATRVLADVAGGHTRVELPGAALDYPILLAPVAYQKLAHADGERATALAAAAMSAGMILSAQASASIEDVAAQRPRALWFQLYLQGDRGFTLALARRAEAAGCTALVVTGDAPLGGLRPREQRARFALPPDVAAVNLTGGPPPLTGTARPGESTLFDSALLAAAPTWRELEWLKSVTRLPVWLKGVMSAGDARRAVEIGLDGIVVSNHGGRVVDTLPATIDALPAVSAAVSGRIPVLLDGGVRRGTDVLKALASGARAVLIGRPYVYALAAAGPAGVAHVLHLLRTELELAMISTGCRTPADVGPHVLVR